MKNLVLSLLLICACGVNEALYELPPTAWTPEECSEFTPRFLQELAPTEFPVEVLIDTETSNHNISLFLDAIDLWNAQLGRELLYATITSDLAGMHGMCNYATVTANHDIDSDNIGLTTFGPCAANHVDIEVMDLFTGEKAAYFSDLTVTQIAVHELGHVLGLPHEESEPQSIMYPALGDGSHKYISKQSICLVYFAISYADAASPI